MTYTHLTIIRNRSGNAEGLQAFTKGCCNVNSFGFAFFDGNGCPYRVCPAGILKTDRLDIFDNFGNIHTIGITNFFSLFQAFHTIFFQYRKDLVDPPVVTFKQCHDDSPYSSRGSMVLTASAKRPYVPVASSSALLASVPFLMASIMRPR